MSSRIAPSSPARVPAGQMLRTLVERQFRLQVKRSLFGLVWPALGPFFLLALYMFVFHSVFRVPVRHYSEYLFAGLLPWTFLAQGLGSAVSGLSAESDIVRRARFNYELLPVAALGVTFVYFLVDLAVFVAYLFAVGRAGWTLVALPLCIGALALLVVALAMILSLIDVYNRDLRRVLGNLLTIWFFLLPVVYRPNMVPKSIRFLRSVDPMNIVVGEFRQALYYRRLTDTGHMTLMLVVCAALFGVCLAVFRWLSADLPKDI